MTTATAYDGPMIEVIDLRKSFGELEVLKGISASITKGEVRRWEWSSSTSTCSRT